MTDHSDFWNGVAEAVGDAINNAEGHASAYYLEYSFKKHGFLITRAPVNAIETMASLRTQLAASQTRVMELEAQLAKSAKILAKRAAHISNLQDIISAKGDEVISPQAALQSKEGA